MMNISKKRLGRQLQRKLIINKEINKLEKNLSKKKQEEKKINIIIDKLRVEFL